LQIYFPVAEIETIALVPPLASFLISFFTSMAGISGAFLLLPFQVSVLGFVSPAVTSTNFLYNVVGTPGGVFRYFRERRMVWSLLACIIAGTMPGVLFGYFLRIKLLPDPRTFKFLVGIVMLYVGFRLLKDLTSRTNMTSRALTGNIRICEVTTTFKKIEFTFSDQRYCFSVPAVVFAALGVGIVSGIYGIGGGALMAPFLITVIHLPVYAIAGSVLAANFMTSAAGVMFYSVIPFNHGAPVPPDWLLGVLFGAGGFLGMYCGAKFQLRAHERTIKLILVLIVFFVASKYILQYLQ
jgi:uncharacterized membrane protein YfcA